MQPHKSEAQLIMMRHGESVWNKLNLFTGWVDVPLSEQGVKDAIAGGEKIKHIPFDVVFTSSLIRAKMSALLALMHHDAGKIPVFQHQGEEKIEQWSRIYGREAQENVLPVISAWQLNERMYGELQGCNKAETAAKFGADQVKIWRRSYDIAPPAGESLEMTAARTIPYFREAIFPHLERGENVFIAAHGNSLRSIIMELDGLSREQVLELEIPLGQPIFYTYAANKFVKKEI
jgi:2,3-bisphosphoglycerate-dependent phosphoglycerate mutase